MRTKVAFREKDLLGNVSTDELKIFLGTIQQTDSIKVLDNKEKI